MTKKNGILIISVGVILVLLTLLGSFYDLELSSRLYIGQTAESNFFGILFAFIGIMPTFVGWSFLGAGILCLSKKAPCTTVKRRLLIALSVLLFVLSFFYFCNTIMMVNANAFSVHWAIAYPIGTLTIILSAFFGYKLSQRSKSEALLSTLLFLALVSILTMAIIMSVKGIMDRPRFRFLLQESNYTYFKEWWQRGSELKSSLGSLAVNDEFSSLPSGHSAYSMFAIFLFPALCDFFPRLEKYRACLFLIGFTWWALTALSRITVGAHYLSDVSIGGLIALISYGIALIIKRAIARKLILK